MTSIIKKLIIFSVFLFVYGIVSAQPDLPTEEVEVIKDFEAALEESFKLSIKPELPEVDETPPNLVYNIPSKTINVEYLPPKIRPIAMKRDPLPTTYDGFLKLGYGIPSSPYAELSYHKIDPKKYKIGGNIKHHSANFQSLENQRFAETNIGLAGTYFHPEGFAIAGDISYDIDEVHFYGYDHDEQELEREQIRQRFKTFELDAEFFNGERTIGDINYSAGVTFYRMTDNYASVENGLNLDLGLTKWFNETHPLTIGIVTDFVSFDSTTEKQSLNNFFLRPSFTWHADQFRVKLGMNLASFKDEFTFFPDIEASANVIGNKLAAFAGAEGGRYANSFRNLTDYNPFLRSRVEIRNTSYNNFYGGVRGNLKVLDYQVQAGFKGTENLALFRANKGDNSLDSLRFNVLYDSVNIVYIKGTLNATPIKGLDFILTLGQNIYTANNEEKAWHLPAFEVNFATVYTTLEDKLRLKGELFIENGVPFVNDEGEADNLNGLFDISLGAHYQASRNFGIFFELNNLASNKRERWANYPTYGLNILGGVTARF